MERRSSAVAERPLDALCHWIFCLVTQDHSKWHCWVGYVFFPISISIETVCMSYCFWDIHHPKMAWSWNCGQGSFKVIKWHHLIDHTTFYWSTIVHMLYHFQVIWRWIIMTLKRSLKVIQTGTIRKLGCSFLFASYSKYGRICNRLWDNQRQSIAWPWKLG